MKLRNLISLLLIVSNFACAESKPDRVIEKQEVLVNGENPEEYFKKFTYRTEGSCNARYGINFFLLSTHEDSLKLARTSDGKHKKAELYVYLSENGTYVADYTEMVHSPNQWSTEAYATTFKMRLSGTTYLTSEGLLVLSNLGAMSALKLNGYPAVMLRIGVDLHGEDLKNQTVTLVLISNSRGRDAYECPIYN